MKTLRFEGFEVDLPQGDLRLAGARIPLAPKVAELLVALVESRGAVVTRQELQDRLWPDTHTDRERGLNNAINRLREALGDSAAAAKFIETVPKRGYRFLPVVVEVIPSQWFTNRWLIAAAALLLVVFAASLRFRGVRPSPVEAPAEYWAAVRKLKFGKINELGEVKRMLETAIQKSPRYAPAHATLANVLLDLADSTGLEEPKYRNLASESANFARLALLLEPNSMSYVASAQVHLRVDWRLRDAEREIGEALRLDPADPEAWRAKATLLLATGDPAGAVRASLRSAELDPLSPWIRTACARARFYAGDLDGAVRDLEDTLRITPDFGPAYRFLTEVHWEAGREEEARQAYLDGMRVGGAIEPAEMRRAEEQTRGMGMAAYWRAQVAESGPYHSWHGVPYKLASKHAMLGDQASALTWLERAAVQRDARLLFLRVNPQFKHLRGLPGYQALIGRLF